MENAKTIGVTIDADRHVRGVSRPHDSTRIVDVIVEAFVNATVGADLIDYSTLDPSRLEEWASSLDQASSALRKFKNQLTKELTR